MIKPKLTREFLRSILHYNPETGVWRWIPQYGQGVSFYRARNQWRARIKYGKKEKHIGLFSSYKEACDARLKEAYILFDSHHPSWIAGTINDDGYLIININGKPLRAHRLAFLYMLGYQPEEVDHQDTDRSNCRWNNLRTSTRQKNLMNSKRRSDNTTGYKGVSKWIINGTFIGFRARICGKEIGVFDTVEEAHAAYIKAAKELFGDFANPG